jgi:hypothetical protein
MQGPFDAILVLVTLQVHPTPSPQPAFPPHQLGKEPWKCCGIRSSAAERSSSQEDLGDQTWHPLLLQSTHRPLGAEVHTFFALDDIVLAIRLSR